MPPRPFHTCIVRVNTLFLLLDCSPSCEGHATSGLSAPGESPQLQMGVLMTSMYADPQVLMTQTRVKTIPTDLQTSDASSIKTEYIAFPPPSCLTNRALKPERENTNANDLV